MEKAAKSPVFNMFRLSLKGGNIPVDDQKRQQSSISSKMSPDGISIIRENSFSDKNYSSTPENMCYLATQQPNGNSEEKDGPQQPNGNSEKKDGPQHVKSKSSRFSISKFDFGHRKQSSVSSITSSVSGPSSPERKKISHEVAPWIVDDLLERAEDSKVCTDKKELKPVTFGENNLYLTTRPNGPGMSSPQPLLNGDSFRSLPQFFTETDSLNSDPAQSTASSVFAKSYKADRVYVVALIFNEKKEVLLNRRGILPSICIYGDDGESGELFNKFSTHSEHFLWIRQTCLDWEPYVQDVSQLENPFSFVKNSLLERIQEIEEQNALVNKFRKNYYNAALAFQDNLKIRNFGMMEKEPIVLENVGCQLLVNVIFSKKSLISAECLKSTGLSWGSQRSLNSNIYIQANHTLWAEYDKFYDKSTQILKKGLYLCHFAISVTVQGPMILVQRQYPTLPPLIRLRDKAEVDELEHEILLSVLEDESLIKCNAFTTSIDDSFRKFEQVIQIPLSISRLVSPTPSNLDNGATILILANVTPLGQKMATYDVSMFEFIPLQLFEMIHFSIYGSTMYTDHFRKMRLLKVVNNRQVKQSQGANANTVSNEMRDTNKKFNDAKWTRQALNAAALRNESFEQTAKVPVEDFAAKIKREISPF